MGYRKRLEPTADTKYTNSWAGLVFLSNFVRRGFFRCAGSFYVSFLGRRYQREALVLCFHATAVLLLRYDTLSISQLLRLRLRALFLDAEHNSEV
jgi:hypothetical protein